MEIVNQYFVYSLIVVPILAALFLFFFKAWKVRKFFTYTFAGIISVVSLFLVCINIGCTSYPIDISEFAVEIIHWAGIAISVIISGIIIAYSIKYKNFLALILSIIQLCSSLYVEIFQAPVADQPSSNLYIDSFTILMVFVIGVIGSGICVYALGYMKDHNKHLKEGEKDRSNKFFCLLFLFLSAMFIIVFSNNMIWMFIGWEVTTLCSFLLIGYTKTPEAIKNSFKQINMNMLGGIAFAIAMFFIIAFSKNYEFSSFITWGVENSNLCVLPIWLLAFAGITKAAQMPFQGWLLGAMVAPTPTSALLHSSTMVKAGVFLLIKLSPIFYNLSLSSDPIQTAPAISVMLVGGISFLICSFLAISQSNAKRVLAYSTIANLGLITACAGVGSAFAVWAGMFLILFHACAKSLLFLCVGTAEHHIGSRDIEDMDGLFEKMPKLARFMIVGMMAMFIAPFGMLISKWAALMSFVEANQIALIIILAFGSAATFMFWAKWIGKLTGITANVKNIEKSVHKSEWISQITMLVLIILSVALLPLISDFHISSYIYDAFSVFGQQSLYYMYQYGLIGSPISTDCVHVCLISLIVIALVLLIKVGKPNKNHPSDIYLAGVNFDNDKRKFKGSMNNVINATSRNMYLDNIFSEKLLTPFGSALSIVLLSVSLLISIFVVLSSAVSIV